MSTFFKARRKIFRYDPSDEKKQDYSHLSTKEQAERMAKDYAKTSTANKVLAQSLERWAKEHK